ncbi:MAG: hypothetical protein V4642_09965 [Bacteroidota bacterium]
MKNLFLPFVVVALFAIGSCGDDASINPPMKKITKPIVIKSLKSVTVDSLAVLTESWVYIGNKTDTSSKFISRIGFPGYRNQDLKIVLTDTVNYFTWEVGGVNDGASYYNSELSLKIDSNAQQLRDISFKQNRTYSYTDRHGGHPVNENSSFGILLGKATYFVDDTILTVRLSGKALQNEIISLGDGGQYQASSYYTRWRTLSLLPFNDSAIFELQFIIE